MQQIPSATDSAEAEACAAQLIEIVPLVMRTIRALMRSHSAAELTVPQFRTLHYLRRNPDCSMSALAEHLGLSVPATSRLIDTLVNDGLVARELLPSDRRYVALHLSEHGSQILQTAQAGALESMTALLAPLSEAERAALVLALEPLRALFGKVDPAALSSRPPTSSSSLDGVGSDADGRLERTT